MPALNRSTEFVSDTSSSDDAPRPMVNGVANPFDGRYEDDYVLLTGADSDSLGPTDDSVSSPNPSESPGSEVSDESDDESTPAVPWSCISKKKEVVISGISARLPESDTMDEFAEHLYNKDDMVTEDKRRWRPGLYDLPRRNGKLKDITKFDAKYFGVTPKQADLMDPQMRMLMEVVHEALVDAGINPKSWRGSKTGVYVGASASETEGEALCGDPDNVHGYTLIGCSRSMFANRLSYAFDFRGPSLACDTACSSALYAFNLALDSIRLGHCDQAIVAGSMLHLMPASSLPFLRLSMMAKDGKSKSFDAKADGYVKAEGIVAMVLQKKPTAKRVYCTVVHAKSNTDGYKSSGITMPNGEVQATLLEEVYGEAGVDPADVEFFEAHGTGTMAGDPQECHAIQTVICPSRNRPLRIGSVKSNMGHCEPTSGLASIAKMIIAMEKGILPPNLHYEEPNPYIPGLLDGRLEVVTKPTPWAGGYVGINSFGFGGANTHVLLKSNTTAKVTQSPQRFPRLVCYSGPTGEAVEKVIKAVLENKTNSAFQALVNEQASSGGLNENQHRGYVILEEHDQSETSTQIQKTESVSNRPVWFVYTGMGCQWPGMAKDLVGKIPLFKASLLECSETLKPFGIDVFSLIMQGKAGTFKSTLNCMVCNCAVQVALTDLLRAIGIHPSGIIGHSTGEILCGYADGCLTLQQTMLCAYFRGRAVLESDIRNGAMAAVGLTWEEAQSVCPEGVIPACHNAKDSVTISGEAEKVKKVVDELKAKGKFAKMVDSAGMPFHSPFMKKAEKKMMELIKKVIPRAKPRSQKWISTSIPEGDWEASSASMCSASYQVNNAMSPVLFQQAVDKIPTEAVCIEIAPHALLQSILRRSTAETVVNVGLLKAKEENEAVFLMHAIGKLHLSGISLNLAPFAGDTKFPVPRGTPMLSPLISWDHKDTWNVVTLESGTGLRTACEFTFEPMTPGSPVNKDNYLLGHVIDGRPLIPFTMHLVLAWRTICKIKHLDWDPENPPPIIIEEWEVLRPTIISSTMKFTAVTSPGTNYVQIYEGGEMASHGKIYFCETRAVKPFALEHRAQAFAQQAESYDKSTRLLQEDLYKMMHLRGYDYGEDFKCLAELSLETSCTCGIFNWDGNWVTFLDGFLQYGVLGFYTGELHLPSRIRYLRIDPESHKASSIQLENGRKAYQMVFEKETLSFLCGGIEMIEPRALSVQRRMAANGKLYIDQPVFFAHYDKHAFDSNQFHQEGASLTAYENEIGGLLSQLWDAWPDKLKSTLQSDADRFEITVNNFPKITKDKDVPLSTDTHKTVASLIESLTSVSSEEELKTTVKEYAKRLHDDQHYGVCLHTRLLDLLLLIVMQNVPGIKMKFGVVQPLNEILARTVATTLLRTPRYKYEAAAFIDADQSESIDEEDFDKLNVDVVQCEGFTNGFPTAHNGNYDLLVLDRVLNKEGDKVLYLKNLKELLVEKGFMLIVENKPNALVALALDSLISSAKPKGGCLTHEELLTLFEAAGLNVVAYQTDDSMWTTSYLVRQKYTPRVPKFISMDDVASCNFVDTLKTETADIFENKAEHNLWLTSTEICDNGLSGITMCMREEFPKDEIRVRMIADLSVANKRGNNLELEKMDMTSILSQDLIWNIYRDGKWGSIQALQVPSDDVFAYKPSDHAYLNVTARGDLSGLRWFDNTDFRDTILHSRLSDNPDEPTPEFKVCYIHYAALNFRDVMLASGRLAPDALKGLVDNPAALLGVEFSGILEDGSRIMGIMPSQSFATKMMVDMRYCFVIPDNVTLEEAATIPICYMTAYLALVMRGHMKLNQSILIHSGSGAVGQACIRLAHSHNARIFVTVGSDAKKKMLQEKFPFLADECFASSRSTDFENMVKRATGGKGVDMIINSLAEEKLHASVRCLARHGKFLEIGKYDLMKNSALGMECFMKNIAFHGILLDAIWGTPAMLRTLMVLNESVADNIIAPLDRTVFHINQVEEAFRYMASGKHIGKILLKFRDEPPTPPGRTLIPIETIQKVEVSAICKPVPNKNHVYLVTGGLGGFGFELLRWLVQRGAKKVVLSSRRGVRSGYQAYYIALFKKEGINVRLCHEDITTKEGVEKAIQFCQEEGPLGGIFHLAMVLRDTLLENQTAENFRDSGAAKYYGTKYLDEVTRKLCGDELKWFVCFSSQTAARGNSGQMAYGWANSCMERFMEQRRHNGLAGQAIQWGAIGDVGIIIDNKGDNNTLVNGLVPQRLPSCLQCLDMVMVNNYVLCGVYVRHESEKGGKLLKQDALTTIANIVGIKDVNSMDLNAKLSDLGIDSLMGMEIVQMLERNYDLVLSMKDLRSMTLLDIKEMTSGKKSTTKNEKKQTKFSFNIRIERSQVTDDIYKILLPMNQLTESANSKAVYFVHPIEGVAVPLQSLVAKLDNAAYCLQCTPDTPQQRIEDMAAAYIKAISDHRGELRSADFHLVGYSYGAVVVYEMACQLAAVGLQPASVTLVDSAPLYWQVMNQRYKLLGGFNENASLDSQPDVWPLLQTELISYLGSHYGVTDDAVKRELVVCKSTQDRMDAMAKHLCAVEDAFFTDPKLASFVCETLWNKYLMADRYSTDGKQYAGSMHLIKASQTLLTGIADDYGLSKIVSGGVQVLTVEGDHDSLVLGDGIEATVAALNDIFQKKSS